MPARADPNSARTSDCLRRSASDSDIVLRRYASAGLLAHSGAGTDETQGFAVPSCLVARKTNEQETDELTAARVLGSSLCVSECGPVTGKAASLKAKHKEALSRMHNQRRRAQSDPTQEQSVPLKECRLMIERITAKMQNKVDACEEKVQGSLKLQHAAEEELLNSRRVFNNESAELLMQVEVLRSVKLQLSRQIKELEKRCRTLEDSFEQCCGKDTCVVCMEAPSNAVFLKCGHMVCCEGCAESLACCPMCREKATDWMKIYRS